MNVLIRADASVEIGSGHVMRCLTLADELRSRGAAVAFACRAFDGNLLEHIHQQGFRTYAFKPPTAQQISSLANEARSMYQRWLGVPWSYDAGQTAELAQALHTDLLIVDHYGIDAQWHTQLRPYVKRIVCIDDIANRSLNCDVLLDQNLYDNPQARYSLRVPPTCHTLLGPRFALLRPEFSKHRTTPARQHDGSIRRIVIFFGGSDPSNETAKAVQALQLLNHPTLMADVIVGIANPHKHDVERLCSTMPNVAFHCQIPNMADFMDCADLALGAGGSTTWERCCLGLPTIAVVIAENQREMTETAARKRIQWNVGWHEQVTPEVIASAIEHCLAHPQEVATTSQAAQKLVDGLGVQRVANYLCT
jgi:UDP-2,4-diacetamido-2,4,6-trideoxy-beta-L-altropyranose hydrolase